MNRNKKNKVHGKKNKAKLKEADTQVGKQFPEKQAEWPYGRNKELLQSAAFFLAHDGESRQERRDIEKHDGREARQEKIGRTGVRIEQKFRTHLNGKFRAILQNAAQGFVEADGVGDVNGLSGDGRIGRKASCMASACDAALLEMRIPRESAAKRYGSERKASSSRLP